MKLIPLTQGKFAKVDDEDFEFLSQWNWHAHKSYNSKNTFYAYRCASVMEIKSGSPALISMHRVILNLTNKNEIADHINHDGLDNQKLNLRKATWKENRMNKTGHGNSKYLGVHHESSHKGKYKYYRARITINGQQISLGCYKNEEEAAIAYNNAAEKYHREFANLNQL